MLVCPTKHALSIFSTLVREYGRNGKVSTSTVKFQRIGYAKELMAASSSSEHERQTVGHGLFKWSSTRTLLVYAWQVPNLLYVTNCLVREM